MNSDNKKKHWETVYETKNPNEVSWTQEVPKLPLTLFLL
jgi:ribosomal protein L24E